MHSAPNGAVIVPGQPSESELVSRIFSDDPEERMPPPTSRFSLSAEQKQTLRRWVTEGAEYKPHWAFVAPSQAEPPRVKQRSWPKNPIDRFILARIEQEKLKPSPETDRHTLIRRVSLDLIGLPPTPEEVDASVADKSADAYERLVMDVIRGSQTLFMRRDEVEAAWSWIDPILEAWADSRQETQLYTAGTWGPSGSVALIERDGRTWHESN